MAPTDAAPPTASGATPPRTVVQAAARAVAELSSLGAIHVAETARYCDAPDARGGGAHAACRWSFLVRPREPSQAGVVGEVTIEERSNEVTFRSEHHPVGHLPVPEYLEWHAFAGKLMATVERSRDVARICSDQKKRGGDCLVLMGLPGERSCPPGRAVDDPCLWEIFVHVTGGETMENIATFYVEPGTLAPVLVTGLGCNRMPIAAWSKRYADFARGVALPDGCAP